MEVALPSALAALALVLAYWALRRGRRRVGVPARTKEERAGRTTVALDVDGVDPQSESVRRLVHEAGARVLAGSPDVGEVAVLGRSGRLLGRVTRTTAAPRMGTFPPLSLLEPHVAHRTTQRSRGLEDEIRPTVTPGFDAHERPAARRPLADCFDLSSIVRDRLRDPDDLADIVRSILEAAGLPVQISGDIVRSGDTALIVVPTVRGILRHDTLSRAYVRFRETGAPRGIVLGVAMMDPLEVRRRELLAPELRHAGGEAIQRMADAVAVGANPLNFALGPTTLPASDGSVKA